MSLAYLFCADGFEEVEGLTVVDLLRRADIDVRTVSIMKKTQVTSAHNITLQTDTTFEEINEEADFLILPGGMPGTYNLRDHEGLCALLKKHYEAGKWMGAICAAPCIFAKMGFLKDKNATSYPGFVKDDECKAYLEEPVVVDGHVVTSRGMGTAILFGLKIIEILKGKEEADKVASSIIFSRS